MAASRDSAAHPLHTVAAVLLATLASTGRIQAATTVLEILISGGTVVTSEGRFDADVQVRDRIIVEIGTGLAAEAGARVMGATGLLVIHRNRRLDDAIVRVACDHSDDQSVDRLFERIVT